MKQIFTILAMAAMVACGGGEKKKSNDAQAPNQNENCPECTHNDNCTECAREENCTEYCCALIRVGVPLSVLTSYTSYKVTHPCKSVRV